jgi:hypothetical protein
MAVYAPVHRCVAVRAWQVLLCCLAATLLHTASAAQSEGSSDGAEDWIADFRRVPSPILRHDSSSSGKKTNSFSKSFEKNDVATTGGYTRLSYDCTVAEDQFVNLDTALFGVAKVTCKGGQLSISTAAAEGMKELRRALAHSPSGLLYGGKWSCPSVHGHAAAPIYRSVCFVSCFVFFCSYWEVYVFA